VLARAVAQDLYGKDRSAAVIGQITAAMVVAPMVAPALSGLIVESVGWRGIFALVAAGAFGLAFWAHACFGACSLAGFLFFVGAAPYVMEEAYGARPSVYGLFFMPLAAIYMLANMACGRMTSRYGGRRMIIFGGSCTIAAMVAGLAVMSAGVANPLALMVPAFFHSIGAGLSVPNAVAGAVGAAPARAGAASGLLGFIQFLTAAATTQIAGFLPHDIAAPILAGMAVLSILGLSGFLALGCGVTAGPAVRS